jgi:ubiquinol-cytochrome c reductase cytochrome c1 subunit
MTRKDGFEMIRTLTLSALAALGLSAGGALAAGGAGEVTDYEFSFEGPFGTYDQMQLQRGLQVYTQVCSGCHGMEYVPLRTLGNEGGPDLPDDQVRAYAEMWEVYDPELDGGLGGYRTAKPTDHFPESQMESAPDMSLIAKARAGFSGPYGTGLAQLFKGMGGPEYIASLLQGYTGEDKMEAGTLLYENTVYPGGWIAMAPPLYGDDVVYEDGTEATVAQESKDVAAFLMWAAEPKMMARKQAGFVGVVFLGVLTVLLYLTNKRIWAPVKARAKDTPAE